MSVTSSLHRIEDVYAEGVRIAVTANSAYDLFLSRELKSAQLVRAVTTPESIEMMTSLGLEALAGVRSTLVAAMQQIPGSRLMTGHFMTIPQALAVPKRRNQSLQFLSAFSSSSISRVNGPEE